MATIKIKTREGNKRKYMCTQNRVVKLQNKEQDIA